MTVDRWDDAACAGHPNPEWWDQPDRGGPNTARRLLAAAVCGTCPVKDRCADRTTREHAGQVRAGLVVGRRGELRPISPTRKPTTPGIAECGTPAAVARHRRREEACAACGVDADGRRTEVTRAYVACGSRSAWDRHRRRDESCFACWPDTGRPRQYRRAEPPAGSASTSGESLDVPTGSRNPGKAPGFREAPPRGAAPR